MPHTPSGMSLPLRGFIPFHEDIDAVPGGTRRVPGPQYNPGNNSFQVPSPRVDPLPLSHTGKSKIEKYNLPKPTQCT
jgi:hypothetical protein